MTAYRVIGIDPALTNVGLCVLDSDKPGDYRVTASETIKTNTKQTMLGRLRAIHQGVGGFISDVTPGGDMYRHAVIEDPTGQIRVHRGKNPRSIAVMGLAVGVVASVALDYCAVVDFIDTDEWMPKVKSGNFTHIMPSAELTRYLLCQIKVPAGASEHVTMAAGVARYWIEQDRRAERMVAATR